MRINQYIASAGVTSRRKADELIEELVNMDTSNFNPSAWAWSAITFQWNTYTRTITPTEDFTIDCDNVVYKARIRMDH